MQLTNKRITNLLFVTQGVGIIFVFVFLIAYLAGLPSTNVLHSEPVFRVPLTILGIVLIALLLATIVLSVYSKRAPE